MATLDQLRIETKAREDEKAAVEVLLEKERSAAAARKRSADEDAAALAEERTKCQKLEDSNKVRWQVLRYSTELMAVNAADSSVHCMAPADWQLTGLRVGWGYYSTMESIVLA